MTKIKWTRKAIKKNQRGDEVKGCWEHNGWLDGVLMFTITVSDGSEYDRQILAHSRVRGLWSTEEPKGWDFEKFPDFAGDRGGVFREGSPREHRQEWEKDRAPYESPEAAMRDVETKWEEWKKRFT